MKTKAEPRRCGSLYVEKHECAFVSSASFCHLTITSIIHKREREREMQGDVQGCEKVGDALPDSHMGLVEILA